VIGHNVRIDAGCRIEESVILDGSIIGAGSHSRVIADPSMSCRNTTLGGDAITVLPRGRSIGRRAVNVTRG
jgi:NDP-sugar pyrophosphorylase family protein